ncbi:MAG: hypothetical protein QF535_16015, partial [Anaerolineales bacterium]|nr:hypothetical protein [Anaerolineales bacterium]
MLILNINLVSAYNCWDYDDDQTSCDAKSDCIYHSESWGGWCEELNCWSLWSQTDCTNTTLTADIGKDCQWKNPSSFGWCEQTSCWSLKSTNESYCETAATNGGLNCTWDGQYCMSGGCWNNGDSTSCGADSGCTWETGSGSGWCEEVQCWGFDSWNNGNETYCEDNPYGLSCAWYNNTVSNSSAGEGWCDPDMGSTTCANFTSDRDCMDTYYCWWQWGDWTNTSAGGTCSEPSWIEEGLNSS